MPPDPLEACVPMILGMVDCLARPSPCCFRWPCTMVKNFSMGNNIEHISWYKLTFVRMGMCREIHGLHFYVWWRWVPMGALFGFLKTNRKCMYFPMDEEDCC